MRNAQLVIQVVDEKQGDSLNWDIQDVAQKLADPLATWNYWDEKGNGKRIDKSKNEAKSQIASNFPKMAFDQVAAGFEGGQTPNVFIDHNHDGKNKPHWKNDAGDN